MLKLVNGLHKPRQKLPINLAMPIIDPLLQLAASPEEMWNIVAEICQGRAGGDHPFKPATSTGHPSCLPSSVLLPNHLFLSSLAAILSTMLSSLLRP